MSASTKRKRGTLTKDEIIAAAREVLKSEGPSALTMRRLGEALSVNPMTLYSRFASKEELLAALRDNVLSGIEAPARATDPQVALLELFMELRRRLVDSGADVETIVGAGDISGTVLHLTDLALGLLAELGLTGTQAVDAYRCLFWQTIGLTLLDREMRSITRERTAVAFSDLGADLPNYAALRGAFGAIDPEMLVANSLRATMIGLLAGEA